MQRPFFFCLMMVALLSVRLIFSRDEPLLVSLVPGFDAASSERSAGTKHTKSKRAKTLLRRVLLFSRLVCIYVRTSEGWQREEYQSAPSSSSSLMDGRKE